MCHAQDELDRQTAETVCVSFYPVSSVAPMQNFTQCVILFCRISVDQLHKCPVYNTFANFLYTVYTPYIISYTAYINMFLKQRFKGFKWIPAVQIICDERNFHKPASCQQLCYEFQSLKSTELYENLICLYLFILCLHSAVIVWMQVHFLNVTDKKMQLSFNNCRWSTGARVSGLTPLETSPP